MSEEKKDEKKVQLSEGKITEEALQELSRRIGSKFRIDPFHTLVCSDTIRHFVDGVGDVNPLYRDPEYAAKTRYGRLVAPPSWLYSVF
ncbi:MAG: MaoC family dehydratase N-terminal domain-containing protein, partial [Deltaproteobacteria bacterium]|nr:MaoC family dehydratase N-terminal domain-containing protein [Deltaproteobacteria bacterium]